MGTLNVMDPSGHSTHSVDPNDRVSVENAERLFAELMAKGYTAAERPGNGKEAQGEAKVTRTLNPEAETVFYPRLRGG